MEADTTPAVEDNIAAYELELTEIGATEEQTFLDDCLSLLLGITLSSGWKGLRRFSNVFTGASAIDYLCVKRNMSRDDAFGVVAMLLKQNSIHEVEFESIFLTKSLYRFSQHHRSHSSVLNASPPYTGATRAITEIFPEILRLWNDVLRNNRCMESGKDMLLDRECLEQCPRLRLLTERLRMLSGRGVQLSLLVTDDQKKGLAAQLFWLKFFLRIRLQRFGLIATTFSQCWRC